jgi:hypothetical protein
MVPRQAAHDACGSNEQACIGSDTHRVACHNHTSNTVMLRAMPSITMPPGAGVGGEYPLASASAAERAAAHPELLAHRGQQVRPSLWPGKPERPGTRALVHGVGDCFGSWCFW